MANSEIELTAIGVAVTLLIPVHSIVKFHVYRNVQMYSYIKQSIQNWQTVYAMKIRHKKTHVANERIDDELAMK